MLTSIASDTFIQLKYIIDQLSKEQFSKKLELLNNSSIGQHVRHVLEFYICLSQGIKTGYVNYDNRVRNLSLESDPNYAMVILDELSAVFCCDEIEDTVLTNSIEYKGVIIEANSSVSRELIYLIEHSIHHYAIIGIALRSHFIHVSLPHNFGIAYSTAKHKESMEHYTVHHH
jgi:lipoprotein signal peptidase